MDRATPSRKRMPSSVDRRRQTNGTNLSSTRASFELTRSIMTPGDHFPIKSILSLGWHMGRDRYQEGSLVSVGKRVKKWRGHFYVYEKQDHQRRRWSTTSSPCRRVCAWQSSRSTNC